MNDMSIAEFLLARLAEDEDRDLSRSLAQWTEGMPEGVLPEAERVHDRLLATQGIKFDAAVRRLGWALAATPPLSWLGFGQLAREKASTYADHPDYRDEWAT